MGKVSYNQNGYIGSSMSVNARNAYDDGEMPKSKWTKKAMIAAVKEYCDNYDLKYNPEIEKMKKEELFRTFLIYSSWHHTSKFANPTDFYSIDKEAVEDYFPELTPAEAEQKRAVKKAELEAEYRHMKEEEKRLEEKFSVWDSFEKEHGYHPKSIRALKNDYPELFSERLSNKGNLIWMYQTPYGTREILPEHAHCLTGYDATGLDTDKEWKVFLAKLEERKKGL